MQWEAFPNPGVNAPGGAGTQATQLVAEKKCEAVMSGDFGPNASLALNAAGVSMYLNKVNSRIRDVIGRFNVGELQQVSTTPTVKGAYHSPRR